ncbi:MAG: hypothetical protein V4495_10810 [Pseudomonadota bacterium]
MKNQIPTAVVPFLAKVIKGFGRDAPLDFWTIEHGPTILDGFFELASLLELSDISESQVPRAYVMLTRLFNWEAACQFGGWGAFANIDDIEFDVLLQYYSEVDLSAEAGSLRVQMLAYKKDPQDYEALYLAAKEKAHSLSGDMDRLEYLTQYFCDHSLELLYVKVSKDSA